MLAVAAAPILFGLVAGLWGRGAEGLRWTFLIMLVPLATSAWVLRVAGRTYPQDARAVAAAEREEGR
jgi:MFS family permease